MRYQALNTYILNLAEVPFTWGHHDCYTFTNGACEAFIGKGLTSENFTYDTPTEGLRLLAEWLRSHHYTSFIEALDDRFTRLNLNSAPRGSLIARKDDTPFYGGYALGISIGPSIVFAHPDVGVNFDLYNKDDLVWELK